MQRLRELATDLTTSYVYSDQLPFGEADALSVLAVLDPDENDSILNLIVEISDDPLSTAAASSEWIQVGAIVWTTGTGAFTARTFQLTAAAAGAKKYGHWDIEGIKALKFRVGAKESFGSGGTNAGNARVSVSPYKR